MKTNIILEIMLKTYLNDKFTDKEISIISNSLLTDGFNYHDRLMKIYIYENIDIFYKNIKEKIFNDYKEIIYAIENIENEKYNKIVKKGV